MRLSPRELGLAALAAGALYLGTHGSALPPRVLAPAEQLTRFHPFAAPPAQQVRNGLLLDPILQFIPWLEFSRAELLEGRLPVWNPLPGLGGVHLANDQSAVFSPFSLPYYALGPPGLLLAGLLKALALALGMFLFLRDEGLSARASLAGGMAISACAPVVAWQLHPHTSAFAWVGLVLFLAGRTLRSQLAFSPASLGLAAVTAATLTAGHLQSAFMVALAGAGWTGVAALRLARAEGAARSARGLLQTAVAASLGLGLAMVHLLPFFAARANSEAWHEHAGEGISVAVPARLMALCVFPDLYGNPRDGVALPELGSSGWLELVGPYVGAALLALAVVGLLGGSGRRRPWLVVPAAALVLGGALVVYGPLGGVFAATPPFSLTRNHRMTFLLALGLASLGAAGFDRVERGPARTLHLVAVGGALVVLGLAIAPGHSGWSAGRLGRPGRGLRWALLVPLLAAGLGLLAVWLRRRGGGRRTAIILGAALGCELALFAGDFVPGATGSELRPALPALEAAAGGRVLAVGQVLPPNTGLPYGLRTVRGYDALGNRHLAAARARLARFQGPLQVVLDWFDDDVADDLSVDYVLTDDPLLARNLRRGLSGWWIRESQAVGGPKLTVPRGGFGQTFMAPPRPLAAIALPSVECQEPTSFQLILHRGDGSEPLLEATTLQSAGEGELLFRFPPLFARGLLHAEIIAQPAGARVTYSEQDRYERGSRLHDGRLARGDLTFLLAGAVKLPYTSRARFQDTFLLENPDALPRVRARGGGEAWVISEDARSLRIGVREARRLEVADAFSPGWVASIDGGPAAPLRNQGGLRGVDVPLGASEVSLRYVAPGLRLGGGLSLAALFLWGLGVSIVLVRDSSRTGWNPRTSQA